MTEHQIASGDPPSEEERLRRVLVRFECAQIVEFDGRPIGLLKVARDGTDWELIQIQLSPLFQGRGLGESLVRSVIAEARSAGASLTLGVLETNPARRLYERLGFVVVGKTTHGYQMRLGA